MKSLKFPISRNSKENISIQKVSYLGNSLFFNGEIHGEEDISIVGEFKGKIDLPNHSLTVEQGAKVKAEIHVRNINVIGEVDGNIFASEKVYVAKEGHIKGDISAPRISITEGAKFKGMVTMNENGNENLPQKERIISPTIRTKSKESLFTPPEKQTK